MPDPTPWTIAANGAETVVETFGYLTSVIDGYDGAEQRVQLREVPFGSLEFSILAIDQEAPLAQSLIYGLHDEVLVVPWWQYGSRLTGAVSIGATLLPIADALDVPYRRGATTTDYALVIADAFNWELFVASGVLATGVQTSDTATKNWAAGSAMVYPARAARLSDAPAVRWLTPSILEARLKFTAEQGA
jgi:hypothetical protein